MKSMTERHRLILSDLKETGHVTVQKLSLLLQVSEVTIRKDLKLLEEKQLLHRTHGGGSLDSPYANDKPVAEKEQLHAAEKKRIGEAAAKMVNGHDAIVIASGTTMLALARALNPTNQLTVITSALNVALELSQHPNVDVLQLGGQLRQNSSSVSGPYAEQILNDVSCSMLFLGIDGLDLEAGISTTSLMEARLNQKMISAAQIIVVLADSSKIGKRGLGKICSLDEIQHLITDTGITSAHVKILENKGITVTIV